ncbi:Rpn family recombination-promoting nuclease/putative transposase, nonfunctional [Rickettsia endosymbiont of Cardiosporidium cionae]|nr:Rpn family recombination-promoting nuclease/putative transposase, nonfunctional [Rickettsia endosymbiont of Cardiosporidium cionae]
MKNDSSVENAKHDALFKKALTDPVQRKLFFSRHLPKNLLQKIDVEKLELENTSFIDEAYANHHSDLLFSAANKNRYIYFLVEHQSTNDSKIAWRLRQYKDQI